MIACKSSSGNSNPLYTYALHIPHTQLSPAVLRAVVQEFVTRDGTDHSGIEQRIERVITQLERGQAQLHYDADSQSCNIVLGNGESE